jgi:ribose/xylose/arabinose/galactoside ABC-type transport system permease subunit
MITYIILAIVIGQLLLSCIINTFVGTRIPNNWKDLLKLTFLPLLILLIKKGENK